MDWDRIPRYNYEELNQPGENNGRGVIWDDIIDITTNLPGILDEDFSNSVIPPSNTQAFPLSYRHDDRFNYYHYPRPFSSDVILPNRTPITQNTEKNIYDKIFENLKEEDHTVEAEPSKAVITKLYPHQKQALNWMIGKENKNTLPPFWEQHEGYCINTITKERRVSVTSVHGGILADDMGLGKTLVVISLILTNFIDGKPLVYPLSSSDKTPLEFTEQKKCRNNDDGQSKTESTCDSDSSLQFTNDAAFDEPTSPTRSMPAAAVEKTVSDKTATSRLTGQAESTSRENSERNLKRMNIKDELEETDMEWNPSPTKYGRWKGQEKSGDNVKDSKQVHETAVSESLSFLCNQSFLDVDDIFLSSEQSSSSCGSIPATYSKLDAVDTSCAEKHSIKYDSVIDISDDESVITILDSDEEEEFSNSKTSCNRKYTGEDDLSETLFPQWKIENTGKLKVTLKKNELSNPKPSCSKTDTAFSSHEAFQGYDSITGRCRTNSPRGTLIICPTSVLYNWQDQFQQHVDKSVFIKLYVYYGKNRNMDVKFMKEQDVVITTYQTVLADHKNPNKGPICSTEWLRIVLDEGHTIRNPKTQTAKVIFQLNAQRRWVLSGTPIQNTLVDLWSIINFLKVEPLTEIRCWNRTIAYPVASNDESAMERVFHLMKNLALRRTKTQQVNGKPVLELPARNVVLTKLALRQEQRDAYDRLEKEGKVLIRKCIQDNTIREHLFEIYLAKLRLRQFCCHPMLVYKAFNKMLLDDNSASSAANNCPENNTFCEKNDSGLTKQGVTCQVCFCSPKNAVIASHGRVYCWTCIQNPALGSCQANPPLTEQEEMNVAEMRKLMDQLGTADKADEECIICTDSLNDAIITSRGHKYCRTCFKNNPETTQALESISATKRKNLIGKLLIWLDLDDIDNECPICFVKSVDIGPNNAVITFCGHSFCRACIEKLCLMKPKPTCPICREQLDRTKLISIPEKLTEGSSNIEDWQSSSKLDALMTALIEMRQNDPSIKSIVVSQFTSLLDLIEKALRDENFEFTRLDGKMSQNKRLHAMKTFSEKSDSSPTVFLLSLKAGGVGINLTAATRVFLMEPAWNPASEEQCFDRCHRLGQTKDVEITKFIIENSVEENMLKLQDKKRRLMTGAFLKKPTKEQRRTDYINDLIDFFQI